jgi:response regulator NasT
MNIDLHHGMPMSHATHLSHLPQSRVLLVTDVKSSARSALLQQVLSQSSYVVTEVTFAEMSILKAVEAAHPDIIVIDTCAPSDTLLAALTQLTDINPKPVIVLSEQDDVALMQASLNAGVSAYISGSNEINRIGQIIDVAKTRFGITQALKTELADAKSALTTRKWVDQAKAILIEKQGMSEAQAYKNIRKMAMNNGQKMEDVAKNIVAMATMLDSTPNKQQSGGAA